MERFEGISLSDKSELEHLGLDLDDLAKRGANLFIEMIFRDGFYHADPHPGNLIVLNSRIATDSGEIAEIGILDCGMVGRIDEGLRDDLELCLIATVRHDAPKITEAVARIGNVPSDYDQTALKECAAVRSLNLVDFARLNQLIHLVDRKLPPADLIGAVFILAGVLGGPQNAVTLSRLEPEIGVLAGFYFRG